MKRIFVAGIGTHIGKTFISAILTEALQADYWKPVQAGSLEHTDSDTIRSLVSNSISRIHPEGIRLNHFMSPHAAAQLEGLSVSLNDIEVPITDNILIIEGCGGLLVPLNASELGIDMIQAFSAEVVLVSQFYLGSINHTLLSLEALRNRNFPVRGIIFNGEYNRASAEAIVSISGVPELVAIPQESKVDRDAVLRYAPQLEEALKT